MTSPLVLALDTPDLDQALAWSRAAGDAAGMVKVGATLFGAAGPPAVRQLRAGGRRVMLDWKLHDIPATVAGGVRAAAGLGAGMVTVHALGGPAMLAAAVEAAAGRCQVAAVTVLTSHDRRDLAALGLPGPAAVAGRLARLAAEAGCDAVVCSPREAAALRALLPARVDLVCPGIRPSASALRDDDQARVATAPAALAAGARWLVVGRPITAAADPAAAARALYQEVMSSGSAV